MGERIEAANESDQTGGLASPSHHGRGRAGAAMAKSYAGIVAERPACAPLWALWRHDPEGIAEGWAFETARERLDAIEYAGVTMATDKSARRPMSPGPWPDCLSQAVEALEVRTSGTTRSADSGLG